MVGLAKSATTSAPVQAPVHQTTESISVKNDVVHPELFRYFGVDQNTNSGDERLKFISKATSGDSTGKSLLDIKDLEMKLGVQMADSNTKLDKIYNWLRVREMMKGHTSELHQSLDSVDRRFKERISAMDTQKDGMLAKINEEIKRVESRHKSAVDHLKANWTNEAKKLKERYEFQLKELEMMQKAYGG